MKIVSLKNNSKASLKNLQRDKNVENYHRKSLLKTLQIGRLS